MGKIKQLKNNVKLDKYLKPLFVLASILFALPSIMYLIEEKTVFKFEQYFKFLLDDSDRLNQTLIYIGIMAILSIIYLLIIKNRKEIFKSTKNMFIFIAIISFIFVLVIPFTCSDVFYYLGIGRLDGEYGQNPYYVTIEEFVNEGENSKYLEQDTVLEQGYINDWGDTTVVYGPVWTLICKVVSIFSFGNIDIGLFVFKLVNLIVHLINCYLIYKLSGKKIFTLIYGLNPFILIEGIASVHNDMFVILFTLLSLYFLLKKKNLVISIVFIALATAIKYFTIILLPFMIIYYFRKESPKKRFLRCIQYGILFLAVIAIPYLLYIQDKEVLSGLFVQQEKLAKSFYVIISQYFGGFPDRIKYVKITLLGSFAIMYFFYCLVLLFKKEIKLRKEMQNANLFIIAFLFLLITNFQIWYIMWIIPLIMWQKSENIKWIIQITLIAELANSIFLLNSEDWPNGVPFTFVLITSILGIKVINDKRKNKKRALIFKNKLLEKNSR